MSTKRTILILTANPNDTAHLQLGEEVRQIDEGLLRAKWRDTFRIEQGWAARIDDLRRALFDHAPEIVHFSGHGEIKGITATTDGSGNAQQVNAQGLAGLFKLFSKQVKCVLLNACYSEAQAQAMNAHIDYVIGMRTSISDKAAIAFAIGFYDALGAGRSYAEAFEFGCNAIQLKGLSDFDTPVLFVKPGISEQQTPAAHTEPRPGQFPENLPEENRTAYQILLKKLTWLQEQAAIDADPARKFQLDGQIEQVKKDLKRLEEW